MSLPQLHINEQARVLSSPFFYKRCVWALSEICRLYRAKAKSHAIEKLILSIPKAHKRLGRIAFLGLVPVQIISVELFVTQNTARTNKYAFLNKTCEKYRCAGVK